MPFIITERSHCMYSKREHEIRRNGEVCVGQVCDSARKTNEPGPRCHRGRSNLNKSELKRKHESIVPLVKPGRAEADLGGRLELSLNGPQ